MIATLQKYPKQTLVLFVLLLLLPNLNALEVTIMEARNFISAREMVTEGNWWLPTMNGEARYEKPPLPTWITAAFGMAFGFTQLWALRLPAVLIVAWLGVLLFSLSRKLNLTRSHSLQNGLIGVTSFYIVAIIFEAPWDIYAHTFMLAGIYYMLDLFHGSLKWKHLLMVIICIAGSILSKGPVSLYALGIPFLIGYGLSYRKSINKSAWLRVLGALVGGCILGFSWYLYVRLADPSAFTAMASKETGNWSSYEVKPFWYYWGFFLQSGLWALLSLGALVYLWTQRKQAFTKTYRFTWYWTLVGLLLLSLIPEKKTRYVMPILIPLALTTGFYIEALMQKHVTHWTSKRNWLPGMNYLLIGVVYALIGIGMVALIFNLFSVAVFDFSYYKIPLALLLIGLGVLVVVYAIKMRIQQLFYLSICYLLLLSFSMWGSLKGLQPDPMVGFTQFDDYTSLPRYSLDAIGPEVIWAAGEILPPIATDDGLRLPVETSFYALKCSNCEDSIETLLGGLPYTYEYLFTVDLNAEVKEKKTKGRKLVAVYKVTKKGE